MSRGKFIVFEGLDCSGKTTQLELAYSKLESLIDVIKVSNISNSILGKAIREMTYAEGSFVCDEQIASIYLAELYNVCDVINKHLSNGINVLCSRHILSTLAYAGTNQNIVESLIKLSNNLLQPDLTIYVNVNIDTIENRLAIKNNKDYWEDIDKQKIIKQRYDDSMFITRNRLGCNTVIIDGDKGIKEVNSDIVKLLCDYLNIKEY